MKNGSHGLKIAQFTTLTSSIVEATPRVQIPPDIVDVAQKAFQARQERAALLQGTDDESDKRHQHVIEIIGDVFRKLKSHMQACRVDVRPKAEQCIQEDEASPASSFQLLGLDPLESGDEANSSGDEQSVDKRPQLKVSKNRKDKLLKKKKKKKTAAAAQKTSSDVYHLKEDEKAEDPYFVLMCLLNDLKEMRQYIKELWQDYKEGRVDLATASLTTNASFDILRTYEEDFPAISSLLSNYSETMKVILSRSIDESDQGLQYILNPHRESTKEGLAMDDIVGKTLAKIPQVADVTFARAFYFLHGPGRFLVRRVDGGVEMNLNSHPYGEYVNREQAKKIRHLSNSFDTMYRFWLLSYRSSFVSNL